MFQQHSVTLHRNKDRDKMTDCIVTSLMNSVRQLRSIQLFRIAQIFLWGEFKFIEADRQYLTNAWPIVQLGWSFAVIIEGSVASSPGLPAKSANFLTDSSVTVYTAHCSVATSHPRMLLHGNASVLIVCSGEIVVTELKY